ncbi:MAG: LodA/GoxA family CTQ-dependent oxidase [Acidobacteriota bacterium]
MSTTTYKIHPAIGIARLGNSTDDDGFCISPEKPAAMPIACDAQGNPQRSPDGEEELTIEKFKDDQGRILRQAARFQIWAYDDDHPEGRRLEIGDPISGGGNQGVLQNIQWRVYLANKKASWYEFEQLEGEHGYASDHPRRNADIVESNARQRLIIDPGPRIVDCLERRSARFDRDGGSVYAPTFPPELKPCNIDTLGELKTDDRGRLLVLGGHGRSGSFNFDEFGQPRIDTYANNDGWFDDTSDGPVMARLVMFSEDVQQVRFIDVEYPAWAIVGYPAYVPQILDMVTMDELLYDNAVRQFAYRTDLYGKPGTFDNPQRIDPRDTGALIHWRAGRLGWNEEYKPWFYRDIWPILFRPDEFTYLTSVLALSNYPHNQSQRGNFDPCKLGVPPWIDREKLAACEEACKQRIRSGDLFVETVKPILQQLGKQGDGAPPGAASALADPALGDGELWNELKEGLSTFAHDLEERELVRKDSDLESYVAAWRAAPAASSSLPPSQDTLETWILDRFRRRVADEEACERIEGALRDQVRRYFSGDLFRRCREQCRQAATHDPFRDDRLFLFDLLRQPGEENRFRVGSKATSRIHGLPLMPLLAGDNPLTNTLPSKFFRLTDFQYYLLRQWALGRFHNEDQEGWPRPDPWRPYDGWVNRTGRDLDQGVLSNLLGGSFCPGAEAGWILRNTSIYLEPYRIKADPAFYAFRQTAAQANNWRGQVPDVNYASYTDNDLSQDDNFDVGLQPGDVTKHMAVPWQSDFNECTTQPINITYEEWNELYPQSEGDTLMRREERSWETLWWPGHRPLQAWEVAGFENGKPTGYRWLDWSPGLPGTNAGDLKMVTEWWRLGFIRENPYLEGEYEPTEMPPDQKYISVERTEGRKDDGDC